MKIIRGLKNINKIIGHSAVTIGNFDGFHKGHQKLVDQVMSTAKQKSIPSTIITFEPLPEEYFKIKSFRRLTRLKDKLKMFQNIGIDQVICINFNSDFSKISANTFIEDLLIKKIKAQYLIIGEDFKFGSSRKGDYELLKNYKKMINIIKIESFLENQKKVSSTLIREALTKGLIEDANNLIGRPYSISGRVTQGDKRGHELGYPTANIDIYKSYAINGIFLVKVLMENNQKYHGLASFGNKPTFSGKNTVLEVFIFDFNENIYDKNIEIIFFKKLRDQIKFENTQDLKHQMDLDYKNALKIINKKNEL
ncbi:MAG: bifunctional riboflavin kinase/FMN adenylyltransferase [Gammaproteobacteria bacterium]|nr:bifunctional riboflavin kinase/FMN adenylyltransferase [Gammaproteobacteria bacterium]|tara:strand:+ start:3301 stop:4227 length:927 start_codon:yes stop_codon:yes gene_type:complete